MSLTKLEPCCAHKEHTRPYLNEDGYILTGDPANSATWEGWTDEEWREHCANYTAERRRYLADQAKVRHQRKKRAA